jgi:hypothetical protein
MRICEEDQILKRLQNFKFSLYIENFQRLKIQLRIERIKKIGSVEYDWMFWQKITP